jgi:hypothetical protein
VASFHWNCRLHSAACRGPFTQPLVFQIFLRFLELSVLTRFIASAILDFSQIFRTQNKFAYTGTGAGRSRPSGEFISCRALFRIEPASGPALAAPRRVTSVRLRKCDRFQRPAHCKACLGLSSITEQPQASKRSNGVDTVRPPDSQSLPAIRDPNITPPNRQQSLRRTPFSA